MNWDFSNAKITQSAIGPNARTYNGAVDRKELLERLGDLRSALGDAESDPQLIEMVDDLNGDVASGQVKPGVLADRWTRIRAALGPTLQTTANVAQITSLFVQLAQG